VPDEAGANRVPRASHPLLFMPDGFTV